jgi:hypothetical protein
MILLKDVGIHIKFHKKGKFKYFYVPLFDIKGFRYFILALDNQSLFTIIPILSISGKDEDPHMILSKQILMTHYSNPNLICGYLKTQLDFGFS